MTAPGHVKFWFVIGVALFFAMSLISKPETYYKAAERDIANVYLSYGEVGGAEIISNANGVFNTVFTDTVANKTAKTMHVTPKKESAVFQISENGSLFSNKVVRTFKLEIYALFLRLSIAARWLPVLLVLGIAAFVDGQVARKIKIEGYGFTSPGVQARMAHICIVLTGLSVISLYMPVSVPILWWPIATLISVACIRLLSSNMKQITT